MGERIRHGLLFVFAACLTTGIVLLSCAAVLMVVTVVTWGDAWWVWLTLVVLSASVAMGMVGFIGYVSVED